jgi:hypothetical protein
MHFSNGMTLWVLGAHNKTNLQRRSIRWLIGDETWRWPVLGGGLGMSCFYHA